MDQAMYLGCVLIMLMKGTVWESFSVQVVALLKQFRKAK